MDTEVKTSVGYVYTHDMNKHKLQSMIVQYS